MRVYLAGPMRKIKNFNAPLFNKVARLLRERELEVVNPVEMDKEHFGLDPMALPEDTNWDVAPAGFNLRACALEDVRALVRCDAIFLLPGWQYSTGALAELAVARWINIPRYQVNVVEFEGNERVEWSEI